MNSIKNVRERMAAGTPVFGTFMANVKDSALVVAMAHSGLDFVMLDMEHGMFDGEDVTRLISEAKRAGICPVVRVPPNDPALFAQVLDAGAEGILAPQVRTMEQVHEIVHLTKYPPMGTRGVHFMTQHVNFDPPQAKRPYMDEANATIPTFIQIETAEGLALADEIAATDGVDGLYIGPNDLSVSMGFDGKLDEGLLIDASNKVGAACKRHGKIAASHIENTELLGQMIEQGFTFFGYACALVLFMRGTDDFVEGLKAFR